MKYTLVYLLFTMVATRVNAGGTCKNTSTQNCELFSFKSNIVTRQDITEKNVTSDVWVQIYVSDFTTYQTYGKCNMKWHLPDSNNVIRRQLMCYNFNKKMCEDFELSVTRGEDDCGRASDREDAINLTAKFYSQDLARYMWYDQCLNGENGECEIRFLDLLVRSIRYPDAPDDLELQRLPWHQISADMKNNFDLEFTDPRVMFTWKGPECGFDGEVISSGTPGRRFNFILLCLVLTYAYFLSAIYSDLYYLTKWFFLHM